MEGAIGMVNLEKCYSNNTASTIATTNNNIDQAVDHLNLPPGFKFHPTDEEIIIHYLIKKIIDSDFTATAIGEVDLNRCEPWDLPKKAKRIGEKEWYFFCERDRKYPTGMRTNRATESGFWKATGKDKQIYSKAGGGRNYSSRKQVVGMKKTLVFYKGRAPKGQKMDWVMHEFRLEGNFSHYTFPKSAKEKWVVCRVIHRNATATVKPSSMLQADLTRMNSFVQGLLDSPTLPHLMDSSSNYFSENIEIPNAPNPDDTINNNHTCSNVQDSSHGTSTTTTGTRSHGNTVYYINQLHQIQPQNCDIPTSFNSSNNTNYYNYQMPAADSTIFYSQNPNYHSSSSTTDHENLLHQQRYFDHSVPNFITPKRICDDQALHERHCKVEQKMLSNESKMVSRSQDTAGHSTDVTAEISSFKQEDINGDHVRLFDDIEDDSVIGPLSDAFWSY